jgi:23S rRNA (adenine-N6)-dimethyltransferase
VAGRPARNVRPRPQRPRSQRFLRSHALAELIVREADVSPCDLVVDVGAGNGQLTAPLARAAGGVVAIELDPALAARLRHRFAACPAVRVVEGNALRVPLPAEPFRVVANPPFDRTTDLLRRLLDDPRVPLERADVVVERAVALKRAAIVPSTLLSVYWSAWYELTHGRILRRSCFTPAPTVDAVLLRAVRRRRPLIPVDDAEEYRAFVGAGFERRAPALRRALEAKVAPRRLKQLADELGFRRDALASELDAGQWASLFAVRR